MTRFSVKPASETPQPEDTEAAVAPISPEIDVTLEMVEPSPVLAPEEPVTLRKPKSALAERSIASTNDQKEVRFDESKLGECCVTSNVTDYIDFNEISDRVSRGKRQD